MPRCVAALCYGCVSLIVTTLATRVAGADDSGGGATAVTYVSGGELLRPPAVATGRPDLFARPGRGDEALPLGNWLIFPSTTVSAVFATNPSEDVTGGRPSPGVRLTNKTIGQTDDGIKKTVLYSNSDVQLYQKSSNNNNGSNSNFLSTKLGVIETYQPTLDLNFSAQADFTRQSNFFASSVVVANNLSTLNSTGNGIAPSNNSVPYNQISGSVSAQKNLSDIFLIFGGSIVDLAYDTNGTTNTAPSPDGVTLTGSGRIGYWLIPDLYTYFETALDKRDYATGALSSSGFRSIIGLGSDRIGLFRGELYTGYQAENPTNNSATVEAARGPVFGFRGSYFPLPELTIDASLDQTIGASLQTISPASPTGTSTKVTSFLGQAAYELAPELTVSGQGGVAMTAYSGNNRSDTAYALGVSLRYSVWRSFGLSFDLQRTALKSNVPLTGFSNNVVSLGLSYKY